MHCSKHLSFWMILSLITLLVFPASAEHGTGTIEQVPSVRQARIIIEKQKILSQQSAKAFIGLALNKNVPEFYQELDSSRILFEQYMRQIESFTVNTNLAPYAEKMRLAWTKFGAQLRKEIDKEEAEILLSMNDELLNACKDFSSELEKFKNSLLPDVATNLKKMDELTLRAFDQGLMTQEYLLYFFADKLGLSNKGISKRISTVRKDFDKQLILLMEAIENTPHVDASLHFVKTQVAELGEMLQKWDAKDKSYMSNLSFYVKWSTHKLETVALQYNEIAEVLSISHLINLASIHRAHTQELSKYYISVVYQLGNQASLKKSLQASTAVFEQRINRLKLFAPTEDVYTSIETVERFWKNYKNILVGDIVESNVFKLIEQSHILMAACDKIAENIESYASSLATYAKLQENETLENKAGRLVNISGRQCMDLQRIPIYYVLICKDMGGTSTETRFKEATDQFDKTLQTLIDASINTEAMETELYKIEELWNTLKNDVIATINKQDVLRMTAAMEKSNQIYTLMLTLNGQYAKAMNELIERKVKKQ